jgi:hypothetical protein
MIGVALGGLALVVTARGGEQAREDAVTVENSTASIGSAAVPGGLAGGMGELAGDQSIRLLDFTEIDQAGSTCREGVEGDVPETVRVSNGTSGLLDEERFARLLVDSNVVYGDLDGDGTDEAVVNTVCAYGANGSDATIEVWSLVGGKPKSIATVGEPPVSVTGGLPGTVQGVEVLDDELVVTWSSFSPDAPHCCPDLKTTMRYSLDGRELTAIGAPVTAPAS